MYSYLDWERYEGTFRHYILSTGLCLSCFYDLIMHNPYCYNLDQDISCWCRHYYMIIPNQVNYGDWKNEGVETVQQLADYINKILNVPDSTEI